MKQTNVNIVSVQAQAMEYKCLMITELESILDLACGIIENILHLYFSLENKFDHWMSKLL